MSEAPHEAKTGNWRYQWELFLLAVSFFSRLPVPANLPYSEARMNQAGRYFALVGVVLGLLCAATFWLLSLVFPASVSIVLTMVFSLLLTGAFHEDGLTDMADGIGG
ncbi:adenosylcobinamide-GDP ribazoletransferase, partial [Vibrio natriegens]